MAQIPNHKNLIGFKNSNFIFVFILLGSLLSFFLLLAFLNSAVIKTFDATVSANIQSFRNQKTTVLMIYFTRFGDSLGYFVLITSWSIYLIIKKNWRFSFQIIIMMISSSGLNLIVKNAVSRLRPIENVIYKASFFSFPSGHAMSAAVFYGLIIYLISKSNQQFVIKFIGILSALVLMILIGLSRIYLGVHFPTDVFGGYTLGLTWLMSYLWLSGNWFKVPSKSIKQ